MSAAPDSDNGQGAGEFPTTQWSVVLNAGTGSEAAVRAALETLCRQYWYPLYVFVRRRGRSHHDAEDATQEFLARLLVSEGVGRARQERGRFRTFLLSALRNFLINEWQRASATKRGGGASSLPLGFVNAEERFAREATDSGLTPDQAFDRDWVNGLIDSVVAELRIEYTQAGRGALFEILGPRVWGDGQPAPADQIAARIGMSAETFGVALHRLRRRLGERLRVRVAETVASADDVESELRHLVAAMQVRS